MAARVDAALLRAGLLSPPQREGAGGRAGGPGPPGGLGGGAGGGRRRSHAPRRARCALDRVRRASGGGAGVGVRGGGLSGASRSC